MYKNIRRILPDPPSCAADVTCPDIFELENGDYLFIGKDVTNEVKSVLPNGSKCGNGERIIQFPRELLTKAKEYI